MGRRAVGLCDRRTEDKRFEELAKMLDRDGVQRHGPDVRGY